MTPAPATRYARSAGSHIAFQISGTGTMDLLLVPDGSVPIEAIPELPSFDRFIRRLEGFSRVIRFDRRGMGLSDPVNPANPPTLEQWVGDALAVLDEAGSQRTALLGMAEGGFVLALFAAMRPERVSALVLVNATPGIAAEPFRRWGFAAEALDELRKSVDAGAEDLSGIPLFAPSAVDDERYRDWLLRWGRRSMSPATAGALFEVLYRSDMRQVLPAIRVPTLVIHRRDNRFIAPAHGRYLAEHIPEARYVEVDGADHVPYLGDPAPILDEIEIFLTGTKRGASSDRVLSTILFVDIVRSTEKAAQIGDRRWRELLLEFHDVVQGELERFAGRKVDSAGDGVLAEFVGPAAAVRCACSIAEKVRPVGLEIRAGVHTGECERLGDKLGGIAVHIGARIVGLAAPGEVLASSTVKDLVAGSGLRFVDRGTHHLKGVPDEWRLFTVDPTSASS
jgi:pimeloyl-ACP methyl ester carboxylesterase